jgi:RNA polymerase sporulation-specific sigma factor
MPMILGEVKRYLRDNNQVRVSRSLRDLAYRAMQAKEKLTSEKSREPNVEEIAKEIGSRREDVVLALEAISEPLSLYEPVFSEAGDTIYVMDQIGDNNDDNNWLDEIALKEAITHLGQREKKILNLRFFQGKTQVEVAEQIGISLNEMQYVFKRRLDACKGCYDAVFEVGIHIRI